MSHCDGCPLNGTSRKAKPQGNKDASILVVTDVPTAKQAESGERLDRTSARVFNRGCDAVGLDKESFAYFPAVRCHYDKSKYTAKQINVIRKSCRPFLEGVIKQLRPRLIVALGTEAATQVQGRAVKITKSRGVAVPNAEHNAAVLPVVAPLFVAMYPQNWDVFKADLNMLRMVMDRDYDPSSLSDTGKVHYELVDDLQFLVDEDPELLAYDTETLGLRSYADGAKIMTMQFSPAPKRAYLLSWDHPQGQKSTRAKIRIKKQLRKLLQDPSRRIIGHNLKYDAVWTKRHLAIDFSIADDTIMMATVLDENSPKDLDTLIKRWVPSMAGYADGFNQTYDKSRMDLVPLAELVPYGCGDVDAVMRLFPILEQLVAKDQMLYKHYRYVSMQGTNMFVGVDYTGMDVNEEAKADFQALMEELVETQRRELLAQVPRSIKRKHLEKGLSFGRADFVSDILFHHPDGFRLIPKAYTKKTAKLEEHLRKPSVSTKDHLPYFFAECPFTEELAEYVKNSRLLTANVKRFSEKYITRGRVYPIYDLHKTNTGRSASSDPNGQNFPKRGQYAKAYRRLFVAPPNHMVLEADLSQAELRIAADMANDPVMLRIYREGGDIHRNTALIVMGVTAEQFDSLTKEEQSLARFKAKAVNFGFLYGMGWRKFISYARTQYGVTFTEGEAQRIRVGFFRMYPRLSAWHDEMREFALTHGYVRSYDGRVRHLPMILSSEDYIVQEAVRQAINSPVQEFASSLGVMAMSKLSQEIAPECLRPFGFVHDALYCLVPYEHLEWGAKALKWYMENVPLRQWFGLKMKVNMVADVGFGRNLADIIEMKGIGSGPYNFEQHAEQLAAYGIDLPRQKIPDNNGRVVLPDYMLPILD